MTHIKAPYNFVPLNKKVISPYWAPYVSHDVPFADSHSGTLTVTLTAHSPIFVKDGIGKEEAKSYFDKEGKQIKPFRFNKDAQGNFFIPGSSVRGMVRSVLEVLSFGGMEQKVTDRKYALRDLAGTMKEKYLAHFKPDKIYGGWLKKIGDNNYVIEDCGLPGRISHRKIDEALGTNLSTYYTQGGGFNARKDEEKTALRKYELFGNRERHHNFEFLHDSAGRLIYQINQTGDQSGTLVFTGQPGPRKQVKNRKTGKLQWTGHHLEFIFWDNGEERTVDEQVISDFFDAYYEYDRTQWSDDWKQRRTELEAGQSIPVFFSKDDAGNIIHLGLSYLYKLPYRNSVKEAISKTQNNGGNDLSETIFGHIDDHGSLKGRVHIGHAPAVNNPGKSGEVSEVLSGPKASYFPNYIRQKIKNGRDTSYSTFMDEKPEISGWKRYPVHQAGVKHNPAPKGNEKIVTRFIPLEAGAQFQCKVRYHNLKAIELGALLSALTFHGAADTFHSLGMAKPLGYGKVKVNVEGLEDLEPLLKEFECYMDMALEHDHPFWHQSPQVVELITMAREQDNSSDQASLEYMALKDFVNAKKRGNQEALDKYSNLVGNAATIQPRSTPDCIAEMKKRSDAEKTALRQLRPLKDIVKEHTNQLRRAIAGELEKAKAHYLAKIHEEQRELAEREQAERERQEAEEREARKRAAQEAARAEGLDLTDINVADRDAFRSLVKIVGDYGERYHKSKVKTLKKEFPDGYLPEADHEAVLQELREIYTNLPSKSMIAQWQKPFKKNAVLKKVAEWIGAEKAKSITFK